jgi:ketosteroid isomerase-like protein
VAVQTSGKSRASEARAVSGLQDDQKRADREQTLADAEQTRCDSEQTAADADQATADKDQAAANAEQRTSDRDLVAGGEQALHNLMGDVREANTSARRKGTVRRAGAALGRDVGALARDRAAVERDEVGVERDGELLEHGTVTDDARGQIARRGARHRKRAAADRATAAQDRAMSANGRGVVDRAQASDNRARAAADRKHDEADRLQHQLQHQVSKGHADPHRDRQAVGLLMDTPVQRETVIVQLTAAFARKDTARILEAMRPDVEIEVPGKSPLSGHHRGAEEVGRFVEGLGRVFVPAESPLKFSHEGNEMVTSQIFRAQTTEWTHRYRITFDESGQIERIVFEPDDVAVFDRLVKDVFDAPNEGL